MHVRKKSEEKLNPPTPATPITPAAPLLSRKNLFDSAKAANTDDSSIVEDLSVDFATPKYANP